MTTDYQAIESQYTSGTYTKRNLTLVRGAGATVWDDQGNAYIDCIAGISVANIGHCHPTVAAAIAEQAQTLMTCPEIFYNDRRAELLQALVSIAPTGLNRAFLCNSGTEAVEAALKFARLATGRTQLISTMRSFHGRSMGALSLTGTPKYQEPFAPLVPDVVQIPYNKLAALAEALTPNTAAVILEVVQGEGGVRPGTAAYLLGAQQLCRDNGTLLIVDEIQTAFGRTGKMFACEHIGLQPDMLCLAKALGGGFPIGATLLNERVTNLKGGLHGSTFGGNPLAAAAALATLQVLRTESLVSRAAKMGEYVFERLAELNSPIVREVRGMGLMIGIELKSNKAGLFLEPLQQRQILALLAGPNTLRLLPPLNITKTEIDQVLDALQAVLTDPVLLAQASK
jgi:acetylornithine/LysW-gamma-L-lysine aminotransferase